LINQQLPESTDLPSPGGFNGYFSVNLVGTDATGGRMGVEGNVFTDLSATITPGTNGSQADINDNGTLIQPSGSTTNVTGKMTGPVDQNGRATMTMTVGTSRTLTLALYILAPEVPASNQSGRAFAIDITPVATSKQVLSGQLFWLGNPVPIFNSSSISGVNVFALWGIVPGAPAKSNTLIGTFTSSALLLDVNSGGTVNGGGGVASPLAGTVNSITVASNGRAVLTTTVSTVNYTYVLYLDAANDGNIMGTMVGALTDSTVSFGFFTGQAATNKFNNTSITGTYVFGTATPVLAGVPNAASPDTLSPIGQNGTTFSGTFSAGAVGGNYSFNQTTGRGTAIASSGQQFLQNTNNVFYIITPNLIMVMGADGGVTNDAVGLMQF
jgi:hypothetical protein